MSQKLWTVVKFLNDNSVEAVPTSWLVGDKCLWPRYPRDRLIKSIKVCEPPLSCWEQHDISTFRNATYGDYATARKKCQMAENTSDLNTDTEVRRKIIPPTRLRELSTSSDTSEDSELSVQTNSGYNLPKCPSVSFKKSMKENRDTDNTVICTDTFTDNNLELNEDERSTLDHVNDIDVSEGKINDALAKEKRCNCCPQHQERTIDHLKQILRKLSMVELVVADIKSDMAKSFHTGHLSQDLTSHFIWEELNMPVNTEEELLKFEHFLEEEQNMKKSVSELAKLGGDSVYDFVRRAMKKLITNKLAAEFSWVGLKKKKNFSKLNVVNLFIGAAERNFDNIRLKEIEEGIKKYLRRSNERYIAEGRKEERELIKRK